MKRFLFVLVVLAALAGCRNNAKAPKKEAATETQVENVSGLQLPGWAPDVRKGVNDFLEYYGKDGKLRTGKEYAVFDFDNTTSIFDIQYQMVPYQVSMMAFQIAPEEMEATLSQDLTRMDLFSDRIKAISKDYSELYSRYGPFGGTGLSSADTAKVHKDPVWLDFAVKLCCMYNLVYKEEPTEVCISWLTSWFKGMSDQQIYRLSAASHRAFKNVETSRVVWDNGEETFSWKSGIAVTEELKELWKVLSENDIDVWVCSGSQLEQVRAAVDIFGLHDYCAGILAIPLKDDPSTAGYLCSKGGGWDRDTIETNSLTWRAGKVKAIDNALVSRYGGGPVAAFMDSEGDFHFCTEYSSLKMVICFNTADKGEYDGAGIVAQTALYERDVLGYDLKKANEAGDTFYMLQGRNENGKRTLIPSNGTIKFGAAEERLFRGDENRRMMESYKEQGLSVKDIFDTYALGNIKGFTGYHSR